MTCFVTRYKPNILKPMEAYLYHLVSSRVITKHRERNAQHIHTLWENKEIKISIKIRGHDQPGPLPKIAYELINGFWGDIKWYLVWTLNSDCTNVIFGCLITNSRSNTRIISNSEDNHGTHAFKII